MFRQDLVLMRLAGILLFDPCRMSYDKLRISRIDSKVKRVEEATTGDDINEKGNEFKSKERIEVHDL